ncbi:MAG: hypothetical protein OJF49_001067 [Ktedonobacterales bacterium]|jgi:hypothetical protein|nr:MAG: hypothetical protein OJF49_001067 [Ktedonobacterales bacterium]
MADEVPETAYYYPNPMWGNGDWVKNLILFFDGIALLVPNYMRDRPFWFDPAIVAGLEQHGLLTILKPETFIDHSTTEALATAMTDILVSGALDGLAAEPTRFHELSYSRLGAVADEGLASMIRDELISRGLAKQSEDNVSIPMHPLVRSLILVLLGQLLRPVGKAKGLDLQPVTDTPQIHEALKELLSLPTEPSAAHVVSLDMQTVGVDLGPIPIDEVLDFRAQNRPHYRAYARNVRKFVREIGQLPLDDQQEELHARQAELADAAAQLRTLAQKAWRRPLAFGLGLAGAAWQVKQGDVLGGLLALGAAAAAAELTSPVEVGAFSYLFNARLRFE